MEIINNNRQKIIGNECMLRLATSLKRNICPSNVVINISIKSINRIEIYII